MYFSATPINYERGTFKMTNFRKMLLSTAAVGLVAVAATSTTSAGEVEKKFAWSGQVNRTIATGDDGEETFLIHEDGNMSGSRARMKASAKTEAMTIGATIELAMQAGKGVSQHNAGSDGFSIRHSYVHVSNSMGKLDFGDTAHAGESFAVLDMSNTGNAEGLVVTAFDAIKFKDSGSADGLPAAGVAVSKGHGSDFSAGRGSGASYTTPSINGFKAKISGVNDGGTAGEITYGGNFSGTKLKAGYTYMNIAGDKTENKQGYGLGISLASGLNLSGNYKFIEKDSKQNAANNDDPSVIYGKIGYKMPAITSLGTTNIAVSYRKAEDVTITGDDFEAYSFLVNQGVNDYGTTVYGGFSNIAYDTTLSDFDDINGIFMGMKVVF